ncbi:6512_t:CDS:2 [Acaulospora colombiana]|uniref:6512_t:CDS:1 n=1 Tax=Acaulospora colombiana TaxID=27376 RepID=A0ACA9KIT1_9GLOM|nr:6512_t:CDS:2 [Acaulospora colombiana]
MEAGYANRASTMMSRRKTLSRPERYQASAPMLPGKEKESFDAWVFFSKVVTCWAPGAVLSSVAGLHDAQSQQAWREKMALCFIAVLMGGSVAFLTIGLSSALCPPSQANNPELFKRYGDAPGFLGILGWQFDVVNASSPGGFNFQSEASAQNGQDITNSFQRDASQIPACQDPTIQKFQAIKQPLCESSPSCPLQPIGQQAFNTYKIVNSTKKVGYDWGQISNLTNYLVIDGNVLNLNPYIKANPNPIIGDSVDDVIRTVLSANYSQGGKDATRLFFGRANLKATVNCLVQKYYAGNIDKQTLGCFTSQLFLYVSLTVILGIVLSRFMMACVFDWFISHRLAHKPAPSASSLAVSDSQPWVPGTRTVKKGMTMDDIGNDLFTVLLVTCYSEDEAGIRCTCESMASTDYPDDRKLLFLICDGIIIGSGNDKSTPDICVGLMELEPEFKDPQPQSYIAVASGMKQHNMAKVYAAWKDRKIPMICVVKCGGPDEQGKPKPGNRGKRDSQLILMNFFSRVTYNDRMSALDYDLFRKIHHLMGVTPDFFEIVLMVDADTKVYPNSLKLLINCMCNDPLIMGLCGETKIANKRDSWITAIQARKGGDDWVPIITKPEIVHEYSQNVVDTLHQKNLLLLAICKTVVPDDFWVLLSQRRRWINSTIHNLMELVLVRNLCGTFCFSMQFVVFMDLVGTVVLPVAILMTYTLIFQFIRKPPTNFTEAIPLLMLFMVLGLPAILILITTRKLIYIAWMVVYLLALPVWNFILPTYAYWHFDDFSWGETRKVEGEGKGDDHGKKEGTFDASKVPLKRWEDWERTRLRRIKRQERQREQQNANMPIHLTHQVVTGEEDQNNALLASHYDGEYYETASVHSQTSEYGQQQQYYDYSTNNSGYMPQQNYQQQPPYNDAHYGNTHQLQRAPSPRPGGNDFY